MMNYNEEKCCEKDCTQPIWHKNPLLYLLCQHPKCRNCVIKIFTGQEWTVINCDQCGRQDDVQIQNLLKSIEACISASHIQHEPKSKIQGSSLICAAHSKRQIIFFCAQCNLYGCFDCLDAHIDHKFGNVSEIKEDQIFEQLKNIFQDLEIFQERFIQLKQIVKEIFEKEREADSSTVLKVFHDCRNIIQLQKYLEKEKEDEQIYISSVNEEREKKNELIQFQSEIQKHQQTQIDLNEKVENLSNEKEQLWKDKISLQKEIDLLKSQLQEKELSFDQLNKENKIKTDQILNYQKTIQTEEKKKEQTENSGWFFFRKQNDQDVLEKQKSENKKILQQEFQSCPLKSKNAQETFKKLGGLQIDQMNNLDSENKPKELKKIQNINLSGWVYQNGWNYFGEVEKNENKPSGLGRAIAKDQSRFIECQFKNGQCHGNVRLILEDGTYRYIDFEDGKKQGKEISYYANGNKEYESLFKDGKEEGQEIGFFENGNMKSENNYKDGIQEGKQIYYYENGQMKVECYYQDDALHGEYISYKDDGTIKKKEFYKQGVLVEK